MVGMDKKLITLNEVSKVFKVGEENFTALHEVSLEIDSGAFMSFVGPSGSGKTTLLNLIGGLDVPTTGNIFFKERGLSSMSREQMAEYRRENIGFIFQTYNLLPVYSVYENVLFPLLLNGSKEKDVRDRVMEIVAKVGLSDQLKKRPAQLSGGQCQRVAIARALVKDPLIILADEPTANLDTENSLQILELMRQLNQQYQAAVIFSTHDEKVTRYVRREVKLEDGRVVSDKNNINGTA
jgi:putative ABC transport system ATP-binding protein